MKKITKLKISPKILIIPAIGALIVAALSLSTQTGGGKDVLSEAIEGGELTLTSMGRNYESLTQFVQNDEAQARQLLEAARVALEDGKAKLNSAGRTTDEYLLGVLDNYHQIVQASNVMAKGVDNLLVVSENLTNAFYYYSHKDYETASREASYCLQILTPLLGDFQKSYEALDGIRENLFYIPSGQRDRFNLRFDQFINETDVYNQYVRLLQLLLEGKEYLQKNALLEEYLRELQNAIANNDYQRAEAIRREISKALQELKDPRYQKAAEAASKLDPKLLGGIASSIAQELRNRLRNVERIEVFEKYAESLEKYLEALQYLQQGEDKRLLAEQAAEEGLRILGEGQGGDSELQGLYAGLREALNKLRIKSQPEQG